MTQGKTMIRGFVFDDRNRNGRYEVGKKGIPGVLVSNQKDVVLTDENGYFSLPVKEEAVIFICKPDGYDLPVNSFGQPQFYYIHQPDGTPKNQNLIFEGIPPTGESNGMVNFPLYKSRKKESFQAIFVGDIQAKTSTEVGYFRDMVARSMLLHEADFFVPLGDLAWDDLSVYSHTRETLSSIGIPYFPVCGNHDINLEATDPRYSRETFKRYFGPSYYSFQQGKVHFVVLDDIGYEGCDPVTGEKGTTKGWIDERQLQWLANDLKCVPDDHLVFLMMHIPIYTNIMADSEYRNVMNREALFQILKDRKHLFALSAHTHCIEHVDLHDGGWQETHPFKSLIAGAACGAWWKGPKDTNGLPVRLAMDGAPNGFFLFRFEGNQFDFDFCPAGESDCFQMGIRYPNGQIVHQPEQEHVITVNIYRASPEATVQYRIDEGPFVPMDRTVEEDPFVTWFLEKYQDSYPEWMKARKTAHLWKAPLPEMKKGSYCLTIRAEEPCGKTFQSKAIFQVQEKANHPEVFQVSELLGSF